MDSPKKPRRAGKQKEDHELRRKAIKAALRQCMIDKGFSETTLTALARKAGMSVSHLLYYYRGKEAVLLDLCDDLLGSRRENTIRGYGLPPEQRIRALTENLFVDETLSRGDMSIVVELLNLAWHRPAIREKLKNYVRVNMEYLEDLFNCTPRISGQSNVDAAEVAAALGAGFFINIGLDRRLDQEMARRLYHETLLRLANLPGDIAPWDDIHRPAEG